MRPNFNGDGSGRRRGYLEAGRLAPQRTALQLGSCSPQTCSPRPASLIGPVGTPGRACCAPPAGPLVETLRPAQAQSGTASGLLQRLPARWRFAGCAGRSCASVSSPRSRRGLRAATRPRTERTAFGVRSAAIALNRRKSVWRPLNAEIDAQVARQGIFITPAAEGGHCCCVLEPRRRARARNINPPEWRPRALDSIVLVVDHADVVAERLAIHC